MSCVSCAGGDERRKSTFPMVDVDDALEMVLHECHGNEREVLLPLLQSCGHISAVDLCSYQPFPLFPTSIMDGYAVEAPFESGSECAQIFMYKHRILNGYIVECSMDILECSY